MEWTQDAARLREVGVPEGVAFKTKPQSAKRLLERTLDALPASGPPSSGVCPQA